MNEKMRIMVVDDDRRMVRTICDVLKVKGYEATEAHSGEEAIDIMKAAVPDCVLMDIKMSGMNGVETMQEMRKSAPDMPVVLMSAYATQELTEQAREQGAYSVLTKPLDLQVVLSFLALLRKEQSVLVVDDDPVFAATLKDLLSSRGYKIETEADPGSVLGHMEKTYQLVVIVELKLGRTDGVEVLKAVRNKYPTKPVILVTGCREHMSESIEKGLKIGAYTCLYKPLEVDSLVGLIEGIKFEKLRGFLGDSFR